MVKTAWRAACRVANWIPSAVAKQSEDNWVPRENIFLKELSSLSKGPASRLLIWRHIQSSLKVRKWIHLFGILLCTWVHNGALSRNVYLVEYVQVAHHGWAYLISMKTDIIVEPARDEDMLKIEVVLGSFFSSFSPLLSSGRTDLSGRITEQW